MGNAHKITLIIDLSASPDRNLLRGIARYSRLYGPWLLNNIWTDSYGRPSKKTNLTADYKQSLANSDGIIMREPAVLDFVKNLNIPVIIASMIKDAEVLNKPTILTNSEKIGTMGADYFINKGFKSLAFCGLKEMLWSEHRKDFFQQTAQNAGIEVSLYTFIYPQKEKARDTKLDELAKWIKELPKPLGILSANDPCGKLVVDACMKYSISVPGEVAVLGIDNDDIVCELSFPSLSSIELNTEKGGYEAAALLDKMMSGAKIETKTIVIEPVMVKERQSTDIIAVADMLVSDVLSFIKDNVFRPLQVTDIVNEFDISKRSLYTKFRDSLGISVYECIKRVRVAKICEMLIETNKPIKEIAYKFGFSDANHIARFFGVEKGITPTQYRAKYL